MEESSAWVHCSLCPKRQSACGARNPDGTECHTSFEAAARSLIGLHIQDCLHFELQNQWKASGSVHATLSPGPVRHGRGPCVEVRSGSSTLPSRASPPPTSPSSRNTSRTSPCSRPAPEQRPDSISALPSILSRSAAASSRGVPPQRDPAPRQRGLQERLSRLQSGFVDRHTPTDHPKRLWTVQPPLLLHLTRFAATDAAQGLKRRQQQIESQLPGRRASAGGSTADRAL